MMATLLCQGTFRVTFALLVVSLLSLCPLAIASPSSSNASFSPVPAVRPTKPYHANQHVRLENSDDQEKHRSIHREESTHLSSPHRGHDDDGRLPGTSDIDLSPDFPPHDDARGMTPQSSLLNRNIVRNGNAEGGTVHWGVARGGLSVRGAYSIGSGRMFDGKRSAYSEAHQWIDLRPLATALSQGTIMAYFYAVIGGYSSQNDRAAVYLQFMNSGKGYISQAGVLGPVTSAQRNGRSKLLARATSVCRVPTGTRWLRVIMKMWRTEGTDNNGNVDNIVVRLTQLRPVFGLNTELVGLPGAENGYYTCVWLGQRSRRASSGIAGATGAYVYRAPSNAAATQYQDIDIRAGAVAVDGGRIALMASALLGGAPSVVTGPSVSVTFHTSAGGAQPTVLNNAGVSVTRELTLDPVTANDRRGFDNVLPAGSRVMKRTAALCAVPKGTRFIRYRIIYGTNAADGYADALSLKLTMMADATPPAFAFGHDLVADGGMAQQAVQCFWQPLNHTVAPVTRITATVAAGGHGSPEGHALVGPPSAPPGSQQAAAVGQWIDLQSAAATIDGTGAAALLSASVTPYRGAGSTSSTIAVGRLWVDLIFTAGLGPDGARGPNATTAAGPGRFNVFPITDDDSGPEVARYSSLIGLDAMTANSDTPPDESSSGSRSPYFGPGTKPPTDLRENASYAQSWQPAALSHWPLLSAFTPLCPGAEPTVGFTKRGITLCRIPSGARFVKVVVRATFAAVQDVSLQLQELVPATNSSTSSSSSSSVSSFDSGAGLDASRKKSTNLLNAPTATDPLFRCHWAEHQNFSARLTAAQGWNSTVNAARAHGGLSTTAIPFVVTTTESIVTPTSTAWDTVRATGERAWSSQLVLPVKATSAPSVRSRAVQPLAPTTDDEDEGTNAEVSTALSQRVSLAAFADSIDRRGTALRVAVSGGAAFNMTSFTPATSSSSSSSSSSSGSLEDTRANTTTVTAWATVLLVFRDAAGAFLADRVALNWRSAVDVTNSTSSPEHETTPAPPAVRRRAMASLYDDAVLPRLTNIRNMTSDAIVVPRTARFVDLVLGFDGAAGVAAVQSVALTPLDVTPTLSGTVSRSVSASRSRLESVSRSVVPPVTATQSGTSTHALSISASRSPTVERSASRSLVPTSTLDDPASDSSSSPQASSSSSARSSLHSGAHRSDTDSAVSSRLSSTSAGPGTSSANSNQSTQSSKTGGSSHETSQAATESSTSASGRGSSVRSSQLSSHAAASAESLMSSTSNQRVSSDGVKVSSSVSSSANESARSATPLPTPTPLAPPVVQPGVLAAAEGTGGAGAVVGAGALSPAAAAQLGRAEALLLLADYCGRGNAIETTELPFIVSPIGAGIGPELGRFFRGAVVGNVALLAALCLAFACVPIVLRAARVKPTFVEVSALVRFPSIFVIPCGIFLFNLLFPAVAAVAIGGDPAVDWALLFVAVAFTAGLFAYFVYIGFVSDVLAALEFVPAPATHIAHGEAGGDGTAPRPKRSSPTCFHFCFRRLETVWGFWWHDVGVWRPKAHQLDPLDAPRAQMHAVLYDKYRGKSIRRWLIADCGCTALVAIVTGLTPVSCLLSLWLVAVLQVSVFVAVAVVRPYTYRLRNGFVILFSALLALASVVLALAVQMGGGSPAPDANGDLVDLAGGLCVAALGVMVVSFIVSVIRLLSRQCGKDDAGTRRTALFADDLEAQLRGNAEFTAVRDTGEVELLGRPLMVEADGNDSKDGSKDSSKDVPLPLALTPSQPMRHIGRSAREGGAAPRTHARLGLQHGVESPKRGAGLQGNVDDSTDDDEDVADEAADVAALLGRKSSYRPNAPRQKAAMNPLLDKHSLVANNNNKPPGTTGTSQARVVSEDEILSTLGPSSRSDKSSSFHSSSDDFDL